jgi:hypothetical protein
MKVEMGLVPSLPPTPYAHYVLEAQLHFSPLLFFILGSTVPWSTAVLCVTGVSKNKAPVYSIGRIPTGTAGDALK